MGFNCDYLRLTLAETRVSIATNIFCMNGVLAEKGCDGSSLKWPLFQLPIELVFELKNRRKKSYFTIIVFNLCP